MLNEIQKAIVTTAITMEMGDIYKNGTQIRKKSTKEVMDNENFVRSIMTANAIDSANYDEVFGIFRDAITERYNKQKSNAIQLGETKKDKHVFNTADLIAVEQESDFRYTFDNDRRVWNCKPVNGLFIPCKEPTENDVADSIVTFYADHESAVSVSPESALRVMRDRVNKLAEAETAKMLEATKFDPSCVEYLDDALKTVHAYFKIKEPLSVFKAVMKHWMKNVKVSAFTTSNRVDHLWVNFFGAQGAGKTTFVKRLKEPFKTVSLNIANFAVLADTWHNGLVYTNCIVACDECGAREENADSKDRGVSKSVIMIMKSILTSEDVTQTIMNSQSQRKLVNRANFISTANIHIYDIIDDPTGMRRFFEFTCQCGEKTSADFPIMDSLDIVKMWQGIDENHNYLARESAEFEAVREIQKGYAKVPVTILEWLDECIDDERWKATFNNDLFTTWKDEYDGYKDWCIKEKGRGYVKSKSEVERLLKRRNVTTLLEFAIVSDDIVKSAVEFLIADKKRDPQFQNHRLQKVAIILHNNYKRENGYKALKSVVKGEV